jgi:hypothetical protein
MPEPATTQEFWVETIVDWLIKNTNVRRDALDIQKKFTQEPYNMSVVRVLNMMDDLAATYKSANKRDFILSQNWRLAHRSDRVGDFITAFLEIVAPEDAHRGATAPSLKASTTAEAASAGSQGSDSVGRQTTTSRDETSAGSSSTPVLETRHGEMHNKRLEALRANPRGDWTQADLEITASQYAIKFRKATGTHVVFLHPSVPNCVTVPLKSKIMPPHIRAFVAMIDRMEDLGR